MSFSLPDSVLIRFDLTGDVTGKLNFPTDALRNTIFFDGVVIVLDPVSPYFTVIRVQGLINPLFFPVIIYGLGIIHNVPNS